VIGENTHTRVDLDLSILGSNLTRGMDVCLLFFCDMLSCVGRGLEMG
jgi:hypothetical protein